MFGRDQPDRPTHSILLHPLPELGLNCVHALQEVLELRFCLFLLGLRVFQLLLQRLHVCLVSGLDLFEGLAHIDDFGTKGVSVSNKRIESVFGLGVVEGGVASLLSSSAGGFLVLRMLVSRATVGDIGLSTVGIGGCCY